MDTIRIVWGVGDGPTEMASYDAALADAGVHNYNLVAVSSMIPAEAEIDVAGTAPPLGPPGNKLTVVEGRATATGGETISAGLGWVRAEGGPGLFYEAAGRGPADTIGERVLDGLAAGRELRDWTFGDPEYQIVDADAAHDAYTTVLVLATYGHSEPILGR